MKSIFISGGARGIGRATAQKFLDEGWQVGVYDILDTDLSHPNLVTGKLDVTDAESWDQALADFTSHTGGRLHVLDNNAGVIRAGKLAELTPEDVILQIDVNARGVTLGARAGYQYLKATPGAQLVSMCSASAIYGQPEISVYGATKSYVKSMTEALGLEWRHDDIRVIAMWPLWAKTQMGESDATSIRRMGVHITPEQVAQRIWDATHPSNAWQRGRIHYSISLADDVLYRLRSASPDRAAKIVTGLLAAN